MSVIIERDHDFEGKVTYFYLTKDRSEDPSAGSIEVSHKTKAVNVNVQLGVMLPEDARSWALLILDAVEFANALDGLCAWNSLGPNLGWRRSCSGGSMVHLPKTCPKCNKIVEVLS